MSCKHVHAPFSHPTISGEVPKTRQAASGKKAARIAVCNLMGIELPKCQIGSSLVPGWERPPHVSAPEESPQRLVVRFLDDIQA